MSMEARCKIECTLISESICVVTNVVLRRLLLEVYDAVRAAVGPSFPIGVKLNSGDFTKGGFTEDESIEVVKALEARGVDLLEVSGKWRAKLLPFC